MICKLPSLMMLFISTEHTGSDPALVVFVFCMFISILLIGNDFVSSFVFVVSS